MEKFVREGDVWLRELIKGGVDLKQEYRHPQQPPHENLGFTSIYSYQVLYCTQGLQFRNRMLTTWQKEKMCLIGLHSTNVPSERQYCRVFGTLGGLGHVGTKIRSCIRCTI